jgi:hypothetical protein
VNGPELAESHCSGFILRGSASDQLRRCRRRLPTVRFYFNCGRLAASPRTAAAGQDRTHALHKSAMWSLPPPLEDDVGFYLSCRRDVPLP